MEFTFETEYNMKTLALMGKALRKTVRRKRSRRVHIFGWAAAALGLRLLLVKSFALNGSTVVTLTGILVIVSCLLFEDSLNAYVSKRQILPGTEKAITVFSPDSFISTTDIGKTEWNYDKILLVVEMPTAFVFLFSANHAQIYDKAHLQGGTAEEFRSFIEEATKKQIQHIR